jgi:hypothetical protein
MDTRLNAAAIIGSLALLCAGCRAFESVPTEPTNPDRIEPIVRVLEGSENGGWRAWMYRTSTAKLCLEMRGLDGGGMSCGTGQEALVGPGIQVNEGNRYVVGGTREVGAAAVKVVTADGTTTSQQPAAEAPSVAEGLRVYVVPLPSGSVPVSVEVLDSAGNILVTDELRH